MANEIGRNIQRFFVKVEESITENKRRKLCSKSVQPSLCKTWSETPKDKAHNYVYNALTITTPFDRNQDQGCQ